MIVQKKGTYRFVFIDVAIPSNYNVQKKTTEKISKYTDLQIECQRMWKKKVVVISIIIGATGIVNRKSKSYVGKIPESHNIYNLQRSAILGTAHIFRKGTVYKVREKQYMNM